MGVTPQANSPPPPCRPADRMERPRRRFRHRHRAADRQSRRRLPQGRRPQWAVDIGITGHAIDEQTDIKVVDGSVEVVSEGEWKLFLA